MEVKSKVLLTSTFLLAFCLKILFIPELIGAQTRIGTHLGEGDTGTQISIMSMLAANGAGEGFPVTLMIGARTSEGELQQLANAVNEHGFAPIARINDVCEVGPNQARDQVNKIVQIFGPEVIVTFGNEVNNPRECSSGSQFRENYLALDNYNKLSPSALDFYNADYPAVNFISSNNLETAYRNAPVRTANAYGCTDVTTTDACDLSSTNTQVIGTQIIGQGNQIPQNKLYLTEFSLNPNGGSRAPDTDLNQVREFIQNRGPETGAIYITPLIRNVCSNLQDEGRWLLYLNGDFYTTHGTKVSNRNCTPLSGESEFKLGAGLDVETEPRDPENYNFFPLLVEPDRFEGSLRDKFLESLAKDQGYEVRCAAPEWYITSREVQADNAINYYENQLNPPDQIIHFTGEGEYVINFAESKIPLYRGNEAGEYTQKRSSYEGFFGSVNHLLRDILQDPQAGTTDDGGNYQNLDVTANTGAANNLLSLEQQCLYKMGNLNTVAAVCENLQDPSQCYLNEKIRNTDYTRWGLYGELFDLMNECEDSGCLTCSDFAGPYLEKEHGKIISETEFYDLKNALGSLSLDFDNLYRVAFLVIAPLQDKDYMDLTGEWDHSFFYSHGEVEHHPMIIAFKIPDFLTNRSRFKNSAVIAADAVTSTTQHEIGLQKIDERRDGIYNNAKQMADMDKQSEEYQQRASIYCPSMAECRDSNDPDAALKSAVIEIINGSGPKSCPGDMPWEDAGEIFTPGTLNVDGRQFNDGPFTNNLTKQQETYFNWGLRVEDLFSYGRNFAFYDYLGEGRERIPVNAYIVAPLGIEQDVIYEALKFQFTPEQFQLMVEHNIIADANMEGRVPEYLPIKDAEFGIEKQHHMYSYVDPNDCKLEEVEVEIIDPQGIPQIITVLEERCQEKEFGKGFKEDKPGSLFVYGAKIGWMIRKIQENLTPISSPAFEYIQSCERVEDMLLGKCSGEVGDAETTAGEIDNVSDQDPQPSTDINCPITTLSYTAELEEAARSSKTSFMNELNQNWPSSFLTNDWYDYVIEASQRVDRNPALILALGREETAWGAIGNQAVLGCLGTNYDGETIEEALAGAQSLEQATIDHQTECFAKNFSADMTCEDFMCKYSEGGTAPCTFNINPNFPVNLPIYYERMFEN